MQPIECNALIFDLDGVLVDSSQVILRHWTAWARAHGIELSEILRTSHGLRTEDTIRVVAPWLDAAAEARRFEAGEAADLDGVRPAPGGEELLARLDPAAWAIATSGTLPVAVSRIRQAGLPSPAVLVTAEEVEHGKPAADVFLVAAERLGAAPCDCLVFEDAPAGIQAGVAAGMRVLGVATTHSPDELRGAEAVAPDLRAVSVVKIRRGGAPGPTDRYRVSLRRSNG